MSKTFQKNRFSDFVSINDRISKRRLRNFTSCPTDSDNIYKKTSTPYDVDVFCYISFNYSARSVKRWKPVAVSSLLKLFKNSATEIFSFWQ